MNKYHIHKSIIFSTVILLVIIATIAPSVAFAQSGEGSGRLTAIGSGLAGLRGNGKVTISGEGVLWIRDRTGNADIHISGSGHRTELPSGWIRYAGFNGHATISGTQITVALSGANIEMRAFGRGKFILRGEGSYTITKNGVVTTGVWTKEGKVLELK